MIKKETSMNEFVPICIGTGLVALDAVISHDPHKPTQFYAGGSCGNVITILSFLGWNTYPIARLSNNIAAEILIKDLSKWNVKTDMISVSDDGSTPVIIHRILKGPEGTPKHKFEFKNPEDGKYLPSYKPCLSKSVDAIYEKVSNPNVFYFDRINRASIELARKYKLNGSLIFFEPSSISDLKGFNECLEVADVIKFSTDRIGNYSELYKNAKVGIEIETLGKDGLQYRKKGEVQWTKVPGFLLDDFSDTAGAGDWCTAGLIFKLFCDYKNTNIQDIASIDINNAIRFAQALSALNCRFEGARGLMYNIDKSDLLLHVDNILFKRKQKIDKSDSINLNYKTAFVNPFINISSLFTTLEYSNSNKFESFSQSMN
jgi:fructokinase